MISFPGVLFDNCNEPAHFAINAISSINPNWHGG
jgi:hypothetical protein